MAKTEAVKMMEVPEDIEAFYELAYEKGWTTGLPVIPPTRERVERMVLASGRGEKDVVGIIPPIDGEATIEKLAANCVMAGCKPEYFPVVIAAIEAMLEPKFDLYALQQTTNPSTPAIIVNGPIRNKIDLNCGCGCMGPGWRANATIGHAVRLILINIGGGTPGVFSRCVLAQPARYSFCFGEWEEDSPWEPLHVERGFDKDQSTVTVFATSSFINVSASDLGSTGDALLYLGHSMTPAGAQGCGHWGGQIPVILAADYAFALRKMTKAQIKESLYKLAEVPTSWFPTRSLEDIHKPAGRVHDGMVRLVDQPEDIFIIRAGSNVGPQSAILPTWHNRPVTRLIPS